MKNTQAPTTPAMARRAALAILALMIMALWTGCGVLSDYARDNQMHIGSLGLQKFMSPARLKVAVLPFRDEVGLGTPEAGPNMAALVTERFAENPNLVVVPAAEAARALAATGWNPAEPLTAERAVELGRILDVNVIMEGAISEVSQRSLRVGWRRLARWFTNQSVYLEAVLSLRAFDTSNGLVVTSRAGEGVSTVGRSDSDPFAGAGRQLPPPPQDNIAEGLDQAIEDLYYRSLDGLAYTPFKARVSSRDGGTVRIDYGEDVGLRRGWSFVALTDLEVVNSPVAQYVIPGPAKARLVVSEVGASSATLDIVEGEVSPGDFIQTWEED
jgi:hypothetical protein